MRTRRRPRRSESEWRQRRPEQRLAASHAELLADAPLDMVGQCDQRLRPRHQLPLHAHLHGQPVARVQVGVMHDDREGNAQGGQCRSHHHVEQCRHGADRDVRTPGGDVAYEGPPAEAGGQQAIEEAGGTVVGPHRQLATDPRPRTVQQLGTFGQRQDDAFGAGRTQAVGEFQGNARAGTETPPLPDQNPHGNKTPAHFSAVCSGPVPNRVSARAAAASPRADLSRASDASMRKASTAASWSGSAQTAPGAS